MQMEKMKKKYSVTELNIKYYKEQLIGNEYILEGNVISELVFNNYLKYLDNEYNKDCNYFIVSSEFEEIVQQEGKMLDNDFNSITHDFIIVPKCIDNKWMVYICDIKNCLLFRYCTFTKRSSAINDKFIDCIKTLSGKKWKRKEIDNYGNIYLGHQTAYYVISYLTLLLKGEIELTTKANELPRIDFTNIIKEMNEVISLYEQ